MKKIGLFLKKTSNSREMSLVLVLLALCLFVQMRNSSFLQLGTLEDMFRNYTVIFILALGMMCVLLTGGIDISIGSSLAFSGMSAGLLMRDFAIATPLAFLVSTLVGGVLGALVGLLIAKGKVPPIVCTLGLMNIYRGLTYLIADNRWVAAYQFTESFKRFALSKYLGFGLVNNMIALMLYCTLAFGLWLRYTTSGRRIYAVGSNGEAAQVSGIKTEWVQIGVYSLMGLLCGLGGALWTSLYKSAQGDMAAGIEMDVIAACVVGGVSLTGGRGSVAGVFLGALTIAVIGKALPLIGVSQFWQSAIKGVIILAAVLLNVLAQRAMEANNRKRREI